MRLRLALVALVSSGAAVVASGGQRSQALPPPPAPPVAPSARGPAPARPSAAFSQLFARYRQGDAGAAIVSFARWSDERVQAEATQPADVTDATTLEALALFHTEAGIASGHFGEYATTVTGTGNFLYGWGLDSTFEIHSYMAFTIVNSLVARAGATHDAAMLRFAKSWYIVALSTCAGVDPPTGKDDLYFNLVHPNVATPDDFRSFRRDQPLPQTGRGDCADALADKARHDLGDDAEIKLMLGTIREPRVMTQAQSAAYHKSVNYEYGQGALYDFTDALHLDPHLTLALIHKGHLLHVVLNEPSAVPLLEQALAQARQSAEPSLQYLAALFLGETHEDAGDLPGAIPYYQEALTALHAHTASIALGQALIRTGHVADGWAVASRMFGREGQGADPIPDPYQFYARGEYWDLDARLDALRQAVRGGEGENEVMPPDCRLPRLPIAPIADCRLPRLPDCPIPRFPIADSRSPMPDKQ